MHACVRQGLHRMACAPAVGPLLAGAGLREHHRVLDGAIEAQDWSRAEALFQQVGGPPRPGCAASCNTPGGTRRPCACTPPATAQRGST